MKHIKYYLILIIFLCFFNFGQEMKEKVGAEYEDGKKKIVYKYIDYPEGKKILEEIYFDRDGNCTHRNKYDGKIKELKVEFYHDGQICFRKEYRDGVEHGEFLGYFLEGEIKYKGRYVHGKKEGEWIGDHPFQMPIGDCMKCPKVSFWKDGKREGKFVQRWMDGSIKRKGQYKNGKMVGKRIEYDQNGRTHIKTDYKNGNHHISRFFSESGQLEAEIVTDEIWVESKTYYQNGNLKSSSKSRNPVRGKKIKRHRFIKGWWPNGNLEYIQEFTDGKKSGIWIWWDEDGKIILKEKWENGILQKEMDEKKKMEDGA